MITKQDGCRVNPRTKLYIPKGEREECNHTIGQGGRCKGGHLLGTTPKRLEETKLRRTGPAGGKNTNAWAGIKGEKSYKLVKNEEVARRGEVTQDRT